MKKDPSEEPNSRKGQDGEHTHNSQVMKQHWGSEHMGRFAAIDEELDEWLQPRVHVHPGENQVDVDLEEVQSA